VNAHVAVHAAAAQADEAANVDGRPCGSFSTAISARFVLFLAEKRSQRLLGLFGLLLGRFFGPVVGHCKLRSLLAARLQVKKGGPRP
jgi:hypothetical protein